MKLSIEQIEKCKHSLGLGSEKYSYRNYYNSGYERDSELDELVDSGLMRRIEHHKEMGGFYYHLTDEGIALCKRIFGEFRTEHN